MYDRDMVMSRKTSTISMTAMSMTAIRGTKLEAFEAMLQRHRLVFCIGGQQGLGQAIYFLGRILFGWVLGKARREFVKGKSPASPGAPEPQILERDKRKRPFIDGLRLEGNDSRVRPYATAFESGGLRRRFFLITNSTLTLLAAAPGIVEYSSVSTDPPDTRQPAC